VGLSEVALIIHALVSIHIGHIPGAVVDAGYLYIRVVYLLKSLCLLLWPLLWKWGRQMVDELVRLWAETSSLSGRIIWIVQHRNRATTWW